MTIAIFTEDKNIFLKILKSFENNNNFNKNNIKLLNLTKKCPVFIESAFTYISLL